MLLNCVNINFIKNNALFWIKRGAHALLRPLPPVAPLVINAYNFLALIIMLQRLVYAEQNYFKITVIHKVRIFEWPLYQIYTYVLINKHYLIQIKQFIKDCDFQKYMRRY